MPTVLNPPAPSSVTTKAAPKTPGGLSRPSHQCAASGVELVPGQAIISALRMGQEGLERFDFTPQAWNALAKGDTTVAKGDTTVAKGYTTISGLEPASFIARWRCTVPQPGVKAKKLLIDDQALLAMFLDMARPAIGEGEFAADAACTIAPEDAALRQGFHFVLGLILLRKRLLVLDSSTDDLWVLRPKTPANTPPADAIELKDPRLSAEQTRQIAEQLTSIMNGEA